MSNQFLKLFAIVGMAAGLMCACSDDDKDDKDGQKAECEANQIKCENAISYSCSLLGKWEKVEECALGCDDLNQACKTAESGCDAGSVRCNGDTVEECKSNAWTKRETCTDGCVKGSCQVPAADINPARGIDIGAPCVDADVTYCMGDYMVVCSGGSIKAKYVKDGKVQKCADLSSDLTISCVSTMVAQDLYEGGCKIDCGNDVKVDYVDANTKCSE